MTINERIEEECIKMVTDFKLPSKVYLGKQEAAQLKSESYGAERLIVDTNVEVDSNVVWKTNGTIEVIETELDSEFRME